MEKLLDEHFLEIDANIAKRLFESIYWWEKNRFIFNVIIGIGLFIPVLLVFSFDIFTKLDLTFSIIAFLIYIFIANICFCLGWGIDVLKWYYLKNDDFGKYKLALCFWGMIGSFFLSILGSFSILISLHH